MVEAPFTLVAVVLALAKVPVDILEALIAVRAEPLAVITLAVKLPDASRATIVEAPFVEAAVVRALANVPVDILDALIAVILPPAPVTVVNVPTLAVKLPLASRATIVEAPLDAVAVVALLDTLPAVEIVAK
jgi:hypothetical protein